MNEAILQLISDTQEREKCYIKAQNIIENAGLKSIEVDRTQFTARNDNNKLIIRIAVKKFTKHTVSANELRALKRIPEYRPVYDRYKRMSHFEHRPLYEWGYIEFEYLPSNNH